MKTVLSTEKIPIKLWLDDIEGGALAQAKNLANLPFAFKHIAIMPDAHQGYGMPIGGVMATKGVIVPNAVGVDIGCGMCAVRTTWNDIDTGTLKEIMGEIRRVIPVGFNKHKKGQDNALMPSIPPEECFIVSQEYENARKSLGTLGGGNHFIEIQKGSDGHIWIMVHSGSRNLGKKIADYFNKAAVKLNERYYSQVPTHWGLAFLVLFTEYGQEYLAEMQYAVDFALANRKLMMTRIQGIMMQVGDIRFDPIINIAHNYATMENHFGENVMVHRKGATLAREKTIGIIPGSQGTKSYIVSGLGNKDSFNSCSHGAGRIMGRKQAQRELDLDAEIGKLKGIIHSIRGVNDLDEAPGAYKDIHRVMANQEDLVQIKVELSPLAVIKG